MYSLDIDHSLEGNLTITFLAERDFHQIEQSDVHVSELRMRIRTDPAVQ